MQPYQERVVEEKKELDTKLSALDKFFDGSLWSTVDPAEQDRLKEQASIMRAYSNILAERIKNF